MSQQQEWLGLEDEDLGSYNFLCMCRVGDGVPQPLSGHPNPTYALRKNGNRARHWKAESVDKKAAEETGVNSHNKGVWKLKNVEGETVWLSIEHWHKSKMPPVPIEDKPVLHEAGARWRSREIVEAVRRSL